MVNGLVSLLVANLIIFMRKYTQRAIGITLILCFIVIFYTFSNVSMYQESEFNKVAKKKLLMDGIRTIETSDSILIEKCCSVLLISSQMVNRVDSANEQLNIVFSKLDIINKSVRNVRLY